MEFQGFNCRICGGRLVPKLNEVVCSNCNFIQHPVKENDIGINSDSLKRKMDKKEDFVILDVREKWEYDMSNIKNSILIPLRDLKNGIKNIDKNKEIIVICHLGERSRYAARFLIQNGFKNVKNLEGGINSLSRIDNSVRIY